MDMMDHIGIDRYTTWKTPQTGVGTIIITTGDVCGFTYRMQAEPAGTAHVCMWTKRRNDVKASALGDYLVHLVDELWRKAVEGK